VPKIRENHGSIPSRDRDISLLQNFQLEIGLTQVPIWRALRAFYPGVKRQKDEDDHSPRNNKVKPITRHEDM